MATILARTHRASRSLLLPRICHGFGLTQSVHSAPIATRPSRKNRFIKENGRLKLRPEVRLARFSEMLQYVTDRIGRRPAIKLPPVRNSAWIHLFGLAATPEQLEQVTELFSKWKDARRVFTASHAEAFVRRCEELKCPPLALKIFGDHSKYGLELKSLSAAQNLIHSLHINHPLQDTIAAAALFNVYNLPPLASDPLSTAMLARVCYKHRTNENALYVARALAPQLRRTLDKTEPLPLPTDPKEKAQERPRMWMKWALAKVERALERDGQDVAWLRTWRQKSLYVSPAVNPTTA